MLTRRQFALGLATLPLLPSLAHAMPGADTLVTSAGEVTIQPVNHACVLLSTKDQVLYFDPVGSASLYKSLPRPTAILITHAHGDHLDPATLQGIAGADTRIYGPKVVLEKLPADLALKASLIGNGDSVTVAGIPVSAIPAYNTTEDRLKYHPKGVGNGYVLSLGDKKVYVAGDTEDIPEMRALSGIDVAFLPMITPYTMSVEQAADATKAFKPKVVYPYHYRSSDTKQFAELVGSASEVRLRDWYA
jgi:L-ascorbate metabolism protein UlaG (beta-lactamase superfamily)